MTYQVEFVWNRQFDFVPHGTPFLDLDNAIRHAQSAENMGDGASVKKTRVVDENGTAVWQYGKKVK